MKKILPLLFTFLLSGTLSAQENLVPSVLRLTGLPDASDLDGETLDYYESLSRRPVRINGTARSRLAASGLFTPFQIASIEDYRVLYGDILSPAELSLVDGFNPEMVRALEPFLSFDPSGAADSLNRKHTVFLRAGVQMKGEPPDLLGGIRCAGQWGEGSGFGAAWRKTAGGESGGTFSLALQGRRGRVIFGDFHARFGQGLCLWSGLDMTSPTTLSGFSKRTGGIVASSSWSGLGTFRGVSLDGVRGASSFSFSIPISAAPGLILHASRLFRRGEAAFTAYGQKGGPFRLSGDFRWTVRSVHLFGETAFGGPSHMPAAVGGALIPLGEHWNTGLRLRAIPTGYSGKRYGTYSFAAGGEYSDGIYLKTEDGSSVIRNKLTFTLEGALLPEPVTNPGRRQVQAAAEWTGRFSPVHTLVIRVVGKRRTFDPAKKIDFRIDAVRESGGWTGKIRLNVVSSRSVGLLSYAEAGRKGESFSVWGRGTLFLADHWDDRLYCYERDLPGLFSVPALWGRGYALSLYGSFETRVGKGRLRLYARAGWTDSPWSIEKKPGKAELKIQSRIDF
jgi:hypothetical protein